MNATEFVGLVLAQLFHHLWQGLLLAAVLALTLRLSSRTTATTRHAYCSMALVALLALPVVGWLPLPRWASSPSESGATARAATIVAPLPTTATDDGRSRSASDVVSPALEDGNTGWGSAVAAGLKTLAPSAAWSALIVWLAGAGWMLARLGVQVWRGEQLRRRAAVWQPGADLGDLSAEVRTSERVTSPLVAGLLRPTILLPAGFERNCAADDLYRVLAHEQAHVLRRDGWWHLLQRTGEALFFFHPGVRWIARRMEFEREAACDDWAAARTGGLTAYSKSLLIVCESVVRASRPVLAVGALSSKSQLTRRVENMLDTRKDHRPRKSLGWVSLFAAACAALVAVLALAVPAPVLAGSGHDTRDRTFGEQAGETALIRAARDGDAREVQRLLEAGADPNESASREPRSPLYAAALSGDVETLKALLDAGAEVDRVVRGDATPLMAACERGNLLAARLLVRRGADVNIAMRGDGTPLIKAAAGGNAEIVELLLDEGADPSTAVRGDGNPLIVASRAGNDVIVGLLLAAGANADQAVSGDGSPLINAAGSGDTRAVEVLLAAGADPDQSVSGDGNPLIVAAARGNTEMVERLLLAGANPDRAVNGDGSPLINAAHSGRLSTVEALVDAGADVDMAVSGDGNPLIAASAAGHVEIVRYLIDHGATVDAIVPGDETALINAAARGHVDVARALLDAGADPNLSVRVGSWFSGRGKTETRSPLGEAQRTNNPAMIDLLTR